MMSVKNRNAIVNAMNGSCAKRRQVICKYIHYGNNNADFDWLRDLDYFVKDYPDYGYFCVSW